MQESGRPWQKQSQVWEKAGAVPGLWVPDLELGQLKNEQNFLSIDTRNFAGERLFVVKKVQRPRPFEPSQGKVLGKLLVPIEKGPLSSRQSLAFTLSPSLSLRLSA